MDSKKVLTGFVFIVLGMAYFFDSKNLGLKHFKQDEKIAKLILKNDYEIDEKRVNANQITFKVIGILIFIFGILIFCNII